MSITGPQLKAARQLLDWSQDDVAGATGLETMTIVSFERGERSLDRDTLRDIRITLEAAGVEFTSARDASVKLRTEK